MLLATAPMCSATSDLVLTLVIYNHAHVATLVVKLQPEYEAARYRVRSVCGGIGFDSGAIIFVRRFDATWLGYIMAHELGHILLGPDAHGLVGIMRGALLRDDWEEAAQGTLSFTRSQAKQIRRWIIKRKGEL